MIVADDRSDRHNEGADYLFTDGHVKWMQRGEFEGMKMPEGPAGETAAQMKGPAKRYVISLIVNAQGLAYNAGRAPATGRTLTFPLAAKPRRSSAIS